MKRLGWILLACGALAGSVVGIVGSCAIDDEVTWITDPTCTGDCRTGAAGYSCDVDSRCTPAPGCTDWDCADQEWSEAPDGGNGPESYGTDASTVDAPLAADADADGDGGDGPPPADACSPIGGGQSRTSAETLALGGYTSVYLACPAPSRWFEFHVDAGVTFQVVVYGSASTAGRLEYLLYAPDGSVLASATVDGSVEGTAQYLAHAVAAGTFLLRIRAATESTGGAGYSLGLFQISPTPDGGAPPPDV